MNHRLVLFDRVQPAAGVHNPGFRAARCTIALMLTTLALAVFLAAQPGEVEAPVTFDTITLKVAADLDGGTSFAAFPAFRSPRGSPMSKSLWLVAVAIVLSALAVALFRPVETATAAPPEEMKFDKGKALRITRKQAGEPLFLSRPETVRIGDRAFISGYKVVDDVAVYVPVSDVDLIEEYSSVEALRKAWRLPAPPANPGDTTKVEDKK
jgi:hypothetical protein